MRWGKSVVVASLISFGAWAQGVGEEEPDLLDEPEIIEEDQEDLFEPGTGGSDQMGQDDDIIVEDQQPLPPDVIAVEDQEMEETRFDTGPDLKGLTVLAGGGIEGYTGDFASQVNPGPGWSVVADIKPWKALGLELGYRGAANDVDHDLAGSDEGAANGADILRNGGHAAVIVGVPTPVQPYVLAGFGIDRYTYRGDDTTLGFQDDTSSNIPLAVGLRGHTSGFTADLRAGYDVLLNDEFSPVEDNDVTSGRYTAMLQIGGTF